LDRASQDGSGGRPQTPAAPVSDRGDTNTNVSGTTSNTAIRSNSAPSDSLPSQESGTRGLAQK